MNPETQRMTELEELLIDAEADDDTVQQAHPQVRRPWLLLLGLVLVALNLRPALSSLSPLLADVSSSLGLSAAKAGLLTTLPVLCLGLFAPTAPILARRFGAERVVLGILLTLAAGIVLRSSLGEVGLFVGSLVANDDVCSASPAEREKRRGVAGEIFMWKVGGAKAAEGASLAEVTAAAQIVRVSHGKKHCAERETKKRRIEHRLNRQMVQEKYRRKDARKQDQHDNQLGLPLHIGPQHSHSTS